MINYILNYLTDNHKNYDLFYFFSKECIINTYLDNDPRTKFLAINFIFQMKEILIEDFYLGQGHEDNYCRGENLNDFKKWLQMMIKEDL